MKKTFSIIISSLFSLVLIGPAFLYACEKASIELPSWTTAEDVKWLLGDIEEANVKANFTPDGFFSKQLQDAIAIELGNRIPFKMTVILENASWQRELIRLANIPFNFAVFPTYFDSSEYCWPEKGFVIDGMGKTPDTFWDSADQFISGCANLVKSNPEINWVYFLADRAYTTPASPIKGLASDRCDLSYYESQIADRLPNSCVFLSGRCNNEDLFSDNYMHTDHHWSIKGAVNAYELICPQFSLTPIPDMKFYEAFSGPCYGSAARVGLCLDYPSQMLDVKWNRSSIRVAINGTDSTPESFLDEDYGEGVAALSVYDKSFDSYACWFHPMIGYFTITNDNAPKGELLIINDSFGNNMQRLFAEHYHVVHVIDPRLYQGKLQDFLDSHEIDDALILTSSIILMESQSLDVFK